jgi:hypothetical protein
MRKSIWIGFLCFVIIGWLTSCQAKKKTEVPPTTISVSTVALSPTISPTPSLASARLIPRQGQETPTALPQTSPVKTASPGLRPAESLATPSPQSNTLAPGAAFPTGQTTEKTKKPTATPKTPRPVAPSPTQTPIPSPSPTATNITNPIQGITVYNLSSVTDLSLLTSAGGYWTRFDRFHWNEIEPQLLDPAVYYWGAVAEPGLINASADGDQVIAIIQFAPRWAQKIPGIACGPFAEDAFVEFGRFMNAVVSRYSQPPYNVKYWEIGNEPDVSSALVPPDSGFGCWGDSSDAYFGGGYYAEMLKVAYPQIKAADPEAQVLVGGLLLDCDPTNPPEEPAGSGNYKDCSSSRFIEGILRNGGGDYFDAISFHAYDYYFGGEGKYGSKGWHSAWNTTGPVLSAKAAYLRGLLTAYGHAEKPLFNTEVAILCGSTGNESSCLTDAFTRTKADYLAQAHVAAQAAGLEANIWYNLLGWRASGLVSGGRQPRPPYLAYQASVQRLTKAIFSADLTTYPQVKGTQFTREGTLLWVLWSLDGEPHPVELPSRPDAIFDVFGQPLPAEQNLTVTIDPVYIEWEP